ncbi:MAG TPA: MarR family transcriptional regulator [Pseudonocardia sp.]|nr:MarR family transcriptional regulator [Pseudonocardia sp.]
MVKVEPTVVPTTNAEPLAFVIMKLGRLLERRLNRAGDRYGLTASQLLVLGLIARHPGASRADVARGVHVSPQAAGCVLAQLLDAEMVTRSERAVGLPLEFSITPEGAEVLKEAEISSDVASRSALDAFRSGHREFVGAALRHLLRSLEGDS